MPLNDTDIIKIAHLARLTIDEKIISEYSRSLSNILKLVDQLNKVDTTDVVPMSHPLDIRQRMREDKVNEVDQLQKYQEMAPSIANGVFLVPKVID